MLHKLINYSNMAKERKINTEVRKIIIPEGWKCIVKDGIVTFEENKQTPPRSWKEFCERYPKSSGEAYTDSVSTIGTYKDSHVDRDIYSDRNICVSSKEAEAFLALMQLRQLRKAWIGDWDYDVSGNQSLHAICYLKNEGVGITMTSYSHPLIFPTEEMAVDFLNCFRALCNTANVLL